MEQKALMQRSINRIGHILPKIKRIWHYYPQLTLTELVQEIALAANEAESDFAQTSLYDIEDIVYPEGHLFHTSRNLEMGIGVLEKRYKNQPLPPAPIQTALLGRVGDYWRKQPQMRLGQLLSNNKLIKELEEQ